MPNRGFNQIDDFAYVAVFKIVAGRLDRTATAVAHHHDQFAAQILAAKF